MVIWVSVTPLAVAPLASPLPQGDSSVPNFADPEAAAVVDEPPAVVLVVASPWLLLHADSTNSAAHAARPNFVRIVAPPGSADGGQPKQGSLLPQGPC